MHDRPGARPAPLEDPIAILYLLFFLSGASGLIYQVVWVREFGNVFGNTIHSAALVIAVFMCGPRPWSSPAWRPSTPATSTR